MTFACMDSSVMFSKSIIQFWNISLSPKNSLMLTGSPSSSHPLTSTFCIYTVAFSGNFI